MENGTEKPKEQLETEGYALGAMISPLLALIGLGFSFPKIIPANSLWGKSIAIISISEGLIKNTY